MTQHEDPRILAGMEAFTSVAAEMERESYIRDGCSPEDADHLSSNSVDMDEEGTRNLRKLVSAVIAAADDAVWVDAEETIAPYNRPLLMAFKDDESGLYYVIEGRCIPNKNESSSYCDMNGHLRNNLVAWRHWPTFSPARGRDAA